MINFRYHIVSITAVFLALGIGTILGSTFLDRYTVDQLDRNIRSAEERIDDTEAENRRLEERLDASTARDLAMIAASEVYFGGLLTDRPVLIVAAPGVEQGTLDAVGRYRWRGFGHDLLDSDDYYQFEGGLVATAEALTGHRPAAWHNDHSRPENPLARTLEEEISRVIV